MHYRFSSSRSRNILEGHEVLKSFVCMLFYKERLCSLFTSREDSEGGMREPTLESDRSGPRIPSLMFSPRGTRHTFSLTECGYQIAQFADTHSALQSSLMLEELGPH